MNIARPDLPPVTGASILLSPALKVEPLTETIPGQQILVYVVHMRSWAHVKVKLI